MRLLRKSIWNIVIILYKLFICTFKKDIKEKKIYELLDLITIELIVIENEINKNKNSERIISSDDVEDIIETLKQNKIDYKDKENYNSIKKKITKFKPLHPDSQLLEINEMKELKEAIESHYSKFEYKLNWNKNNND